MLPAAIKVGLAADVDDQYYGRNVYRIEGENGLWRRLKQKIEQVSGHLAAHEGDTLAYYVRWSYLDAQLKEAGYATTEKTNKTTATTDAASNR